jgi:hypothetical protein
MTARRVLHSLLVLAAGALSACSLDSRARSGAADVVYRGGVILTMTDTAPRVEALAVRDGRPDARSTGDETRPGAAPSAQRR